MVSWSDGQVATEDSVEGAPPLTGADLRDRYWQTVDKLTLGLARQRGNSVMIGPLELLRFGKPRLRARSVEWPIEGGLLAGAPGGRWRVEAAKGSVRASVDGFRPRLPRALYAISHLQVHLLFTRLFLLDLRGRDTPPGGAASSRDRYRAAAVDIALCLTVTRTLGLRLCPRTVLGVMAGYHIACWSLSGRTLGGLVMRQRVVSIDGRRLTPQQSVLRLIASPVSWVLRRPVHDEIARSAVISDSRIGDSPD